MKTTAQTGCTFQAKSKIFHTPNTKQPERINKGNLTKNNKINQKWANNEVIETNVIKQKKMRENNRKVDTTQTKEKENIR